MFMVMIMRKLKTNKILNEINMIIKKVDTDNELENIVYIKKNDEEKQLEFNVLTQRLIEKEFNLTLFLRKEKENKVYSSIIDKFILDENGFRISDENNVDGIMSEKTQTKCHCITYQKNCELDLKLNFLLQEGTYELTFSAMLEGNDEKILSICPFEVKIN